MGIKDWSETVYGPVSKALGQRITVKISCSSSSYVPSCDYAGVIFYHKGGSVFWEADSSGIASGRRGRSFYVLILCTDSWPTQTSASGMVHGELFERYFGRNVEMRDVCCAGFAVRGARGTVSYKSGTLNDTNGNIPGWSWQSDGSSLASRSEQALINFVVSEWKAQGPSTIVQIPDHLHQFLQPSGKTLSSKICPIEFQHSPDDQELEDGDSDSGLIAVPDYY